jgi:hypothetical protein
MTQEEFKWANRLFWIVKGHLIPDSWDEQTIIEMEKSYFKRLWGNHEAHFHEEGFEKAWEQKYGNLKNTKSN